jgi:hypothetical protein
LVFVVQIAACRKPGAQDLVGTWGVEFANSRLRLKLNPDATFEETVEKKQDPSVVRRTGRWEQAEFEGESLVLHGALVARDYSGTVESDDGNGEWILRIDRAYNRFRPTVNEDLNSCFERNRR